MNKIKCFALGGLDEVGKNNFVVEVDDDIFVFDCGLKVLKNLDLGINSVIPDFTYLIQNQKRIKGVFITKIDTMNVYALKFLLTKIPQLPIFMTPISLDILKSQNLLSKQEIEKNVLPLQQKSINFGSNQIHYFYTATNLPGSCGFTLETATGFIVYTGSFVLETGFKKNLFTTQMQKILPHHNKEVLLLISSCLQLTSKDFTRPNNKVERWIQSCLTKVKRNFFVCCDQNDWYKMFYAIWEINKITDWKYDISFLDDKFGQNFINLVNKIYPEKAIKNYLPITKITPDQKKKNLILVTGDEKWLFSRILRLINTNNTQLQLSGQDVVLILGKSPFSAELAVSKTLDALWKKDAYIQFIANNQIHPMEAGLEDIQILINFLNPHYIFPFNGYHKDLKAMMEVIKNTKITEKQILLRENGEIINFYNGHLNDHYESIPTQSVFVDNLSNNNIISSVVEERKVLAEEGIFFVIIDFYFKKEQIILNHPVIMKGFGFTDNSWQLDQITKQTEITLNQFFGQKTKSDFKDKETIIAMIRKQISNIVRRNTHKNPYIFPILPIE